MLICKTLKYDLITTFLFSVDVLEREQVKCTTVRQKEISRIFLRRTFGYFQVQKLIWQCIPQSFLSLDSNVFPILFSHIQAIICIVVLRGHKWNKYRESMIGGSEDNRGRKGRKRREKKRKESSKDIFLQQLARGRKVREKK